MPAPHQESDWSSGILEFALEPDRACVATICPCVMFGWMNELMPPVYDMGPDDCSGNCFGSCLLFGCARFLFQNRLFPLPVAHALKRECLFLDLLGLQFIFMSNIYVAGMFGVPCVCTLCSAQVNARVRKRIRDMHNIPEATAQANYSSDWAGRKSARVCYVIGRLA